MPAFHKRCLLFLVLPLIMAASYAQSPLSPRALYIGVIGGYGSTDWSLLIAHDSLTAISAPIQAKDKGATWGALIGYQLDTHFAIEADYLHLHKTRLYFSDGSIYWPVLSMISRTDTSRIVARFMVPIIKPSFHGYAEAGMAITNRRDILGNITRVGVTFGFGLIYYLSNHIFSNFNFQYTTGFGRSEFHPVYDYVPFLYAVNLQLAYRILV